MLCRDIELRGAGDAVLAKLWQCGMAVAYPHGGSQWTALLSLTDLGERAGGNVTKSTSAIHFRTLYGKLIVSAAYRDRGLLHMCSASMLLCSSFLLRRLSISSSFSLNVPHYAYRFLTHISPGSRIPGCRARVKTGSSMRVCCES